MLMVKVCGITREKDALTAAESGFDAVGFIFAPSPRRVTPERAREISRSLPSPILRVGVFVDRDASEIRDLMEYCGLDLVQLHGEESPKEVSSFGARAIKTLRPGGPGDLEAMAAYEGVFALLLEPRHPRLKGGTGRTCDWDLAAAACRRRRVILAGGLSPANLREAVRRTLPFGVDVCSGVESEPGVKDAGLMRAFAGEARAALPVDGGGILR